MTRSNVWSKAATVAYVAWGLLHFPAAYSVYQLGAAEPHSMIQGRLFQEAWNVLCIAAAAMTIAVAFNWRNSRGGYWANLVLVSLGDLGLILFVLVPGYMSWWSGSLGPLLWLVGLTCSTVALKAGPHSSLSGT